MTRDEMQGMVDTLRNALYAAGDELQRAKVAHKEAERIHKDTMRAHASAMRALKRIYKDEILTTEPPRFQ